MSAGPLRAAGRHVTWVLVWVAACTAAIVTALEEVVRIRTGETGAAAV